MLKLKGTWLSLLISLAVLSAPNLAWAHDPIFGIGPHTIYKDGVEWHSEYERDQSEGGSEEAVNLATGYGLTPDWTAALQVPLVKKDNNKTSNSGLGDVVIKTKWRFYRQSYSSGKQNQLALLGMVKFPTGDNKADIPLGSGSTDYLAGLTAGQESRTLYYFADLRYRLNGQNNNKIKKGDLLLYGASFGFRTSQNEYWEPDLVILLEIFGHQQNNTVQDKVELANSGGQSTFFGPSFLWSYTNWMIKGGIAFPVAQNLNGMQEKEQYKFSLGVEQHL